MRLIDADEFKKQIVGMTIVNNYPINKANALCDLIDAQPTAYDIDKVIKQLEEKDSECEDFGTCNYCQRHWCPRVLIDRDDAIEIVKTGGNIDE